MSKRRKKQSRKPSGQGKGVANRRGAVDPQHARETPTEQLVHEIIETFYGPLPPPEVLREYEGLQPGLAERVVRMAERPLELTQEQQTHRHTLEQRVVVNGDRRSWFGLFLAFIIVMAALLGGIYLISQDKSIEGLVSLISALSLPAGNFIYTHRARERELEAKRLS